MRVNRHTMTNAQKIKAARVRLGLSQSQFARALGLSRKATVSDWERGVKAPANYVWLAIESLQVTKREQPADKLQKGK